MKSDLLIQMVKCDNTKMETQQPSDLRRFLFLVTLKGTLCIACLAHACYMSQLILLVVQIMCGEEEPTVCALIWWSFL